MRRTKEESEHTKEEIFQAGLRVFSRKGFDSATIGDIAKESGYTRGAIYWHFESKDTFYLELYKRITSYIMKVLQESLNNDNFFIRNIRNTIETMLFRFLEDKEWRMMNELLMHSKDTTEVARLDESYHKEIYNLVASLIPDAVNRGEIRKFSSPHAIVNLFYSITRGIMECIIWGQIVSRAEIQEMIDVLVRDISITPSQN